jgi:prepilin-type processing-associated H-X9-DG protein
LAAILFPVFASARAKARATACLSNQKQIALGVLQYINDFDETMPLGKFGSTTNNTSRSATGTVVYDWRDAIYPYVKAEQVFNCPDDATNGNGSGWQYDYIFKSGAVSDHTGSYEGNGAYYTVSPLTDQRGPLSLGAGTTIGLSHISSPAVLIFCADATATYGKCVPLFAPTTSHAILASDAIAGDPARPWNWPIVADNYYGNASLTALAGRHPSGMINVTMCDGHSKALLNTQIVGTLGPNGYSPYLCANGG